ncbi:hypothetical protein AAMO2058_001197000 [Amorphochlora amoebiformis]
MFDGSTPVVPLVQPRIPLHNRQLPLHLASNHRLPSDVNEGKNGRKGRPGRKNRVKTACTNCKTSKSRCDTGRPCDRCVKRGVAHTCIDAIPKRRGRKRSHADHSRGGTMLQMERVEAVGDIRLQQWAALAAANSRHQLSHPVNKAMLETQKQALNMYMASHITGFGMQPNKVQPHPQLSHVQTFLDSPGWDRRGNIREALSSTPKPHHIPSNSCLNLTHIGGSSPLSAIRLHRGDSYKRQSCSSVSSFASKNIQVKDKPHEKKSLRKQVTYKAKKKKTMIAKPAVPAAPRIIPSTPEDELNNYFVISPLASPEPPVPPKTKEPLLEHIRPIHRPSASTLSTPKLGFKPSSDRREKGELNRQEDTVVFLDLPHIVSLADNEHFTSSTRQARQAAAEDPFISSPTLVPSVNHQRIRTLSPSISLHGYVRPNTEFPLEEMPDCSSIALLITSATVLVGAFQMQPIKRISIYDLSMATVAGYLQRGEPLIIADSASPALINEWGFQSFVEKCSESVVGHGISNHLLHFVQNLPPQQRQALSARLLEIFSIDVDDYTKLLTEAEDFQVTDLVNHFRNFGEVNNSWEVLADYALPLSLHDWETRKCDALVKAFQLHPVDFLLRFSDFFVRAMKWDTTPRTGIREAYSKSGFVFFAPGLSRAYPMHRHEQINENFMLILDGAKQFVVFNRTEEKNLYPTAFTGSTEYKYDDQADRYFEADAFNPNFEMYPKLKGVSGYQGIARKGDLVYIPCDSIHAVQNEQDVLAVAWHMATGQCLGEEIYKYAQSVPQENERFRPGQRDDL